MSENAFSRNDESTVAPAREPGSRRQARFDSPGELTAFLASAQALGMAVVAGKPDALTETKSARDLTFADISGMRAVVEHRAQDQVISVECGISVGELSHLLTKSGQWWPVAAPAEATVLDVIGSGDGGLLEHGFGGPRDLVLGLVVALAGGDVIKCGGKVVKNVTGYDLTKLFVGSRGWLGIPLVAHLRLYARPRARAGRLIVFRRPQSALALAGKLRASGLPLSSLEAFDVRLARLVLGSEGGLGQALSPYADRDCLLALETFGHEALVDEVMSRVDQIASSAGQESETLEFDDTKPLWLRAAEGSQARSRFVVELSCSQEQIGKLLLEWLVTSDSPLWQARPGRGRLTLVAADAHALESVVTSLADYARASGQSFTAGSSDGQMSFRVRRLPEPDAQADRLKAALKNRFDPQGILNPLVSL